MPAQYSPRLLLQQVPYKLLMEFFARRAELLELARNELDLTHIDQIYDAWHPLPGAQRADVEPVPTSKRSKPHRIGRNRSQNSQNARCIPTESRRLRVSSCKSMYMMLNDLTDYYGTTDF